MATPVALPALILLTAALLAPASRAASPPGPPPPLPDLPVAPEPRTAQPIRHNGLSGDQVVIHGQAQRAFWRWIGAPGAAPMELWLPLELAQGQLGITSRTLGTRGELELEWFGQRLVVGPEGQRPLGDEVGIDLAPLFAATGLVARPAGNSLSLTLPPPRLLGIRPSNAPPGLRRVVLDLSGPAIVRSAEPGSVVVGLVGGSDQRSTLATLGLQGTPTRETMRLSASTGGTLARIFTLGGPNRVVIDLPGEPTTTPPDPTRPGRIDPRLKARLGREIFWDRLVRVVAGRRVRINAVRIDPADSDLELRPLSRGDGMEGLSSLVRLADRQDALVAINGGFFNRVRRLPLGALRDRGRWLSGPILNRGAVGWNPHRQPRFGWLRLNEAMVDGNGNRWPIQVLNSGYVQRGLSRYTADWGPTYRSLSDGETAVLIRDGVVIGRYGPESLSTGLPLTGGDQLLVARAGAALPWSEGERLSLESQPSSAVGQAANVVGGGPLLLLDGRAVLNGTAEGFGNAFLLQGAPRTVIGSDGRQLWLITLEGVDDDGPTLEETTVLLAQMGLRDALNLDGGSSTGLVMGGVHSVKGRGVVSAVHNGLGLVPSSGSARSTAARVPN